MALGCVVMLGSSTAWATVNLGQIDDFEDGTTMGWSEGLPSPNPPSNVATGGPAGLNDNYVQNTSSGGFGAGSRQIMFNREQWVGDFLSEGVTAVTADLRATGSPLVMRIALLGGNGTQFVSVTPFNLPNDGVWRSATFGLEAGDLVRIAGIGTLDSVLGNVIEFRLLSAASPSWLGDAIEATLGADNITALPEPTALAILAAGSVLTFLRRRTR
jgi:hypothetical protein